MIRLACPLLSSLLVAACASTPASLPTAAQYDDTARLLGAAASTPGGGGELGSMADVVAFARGQTITCFAADDRGKISGTHYGLTYSYTLACEGQDGEALARCGAATASADATIDWSGNLVLPDFSASVDRSGEVHVTGLAGPVAKFDGTGSFTFEAVVGSAPDATSYTLAADAIYDGVLVDTTTHASLGGEIAYHVLATLPTEAKSDAPDPQFEVHAAVTLAADGSATLVLDGSHVYAVNPATGIIAAQ